MGRKDLLPHEKPSGGVWHDEDHTPEENNPHNIRYLRGIALPSRDASGGPSVGQAGILDAGTASHGPFSPQPGEVPTSSAPAPNTPKTGRPE